MVSSYQSAKLVKELRFRLGMIQEQFAVEIVDYQPYIVNLADESTDLRVVD